ncbi:hypothetical protein EOA16_15385 [Mesorhizobium sp. M7A.F.Ca.US.008.03.1.1]|nr:hypothetical protein EOA16_15385 [Mesorhizobium sp. M7A.F.Ca.US.008.03.1.1]
MGPATFRRSPARRRPAASGHRRRLSLRGEDCRVAADANLGDAAGGLSLADGTTLRTTAAFTSARNITLTSGTGMVQTDADRTLSGPIAGAGRLSKIGAGTLTLAGTNTYAGPTMVTAGELYVDGDNSASTGAVSVASGATLRGKA